MNNKSDLRNTISSFHNPNTTWPVKSHEEFMDKFFRKGRFHKDVPESIVKDYELVERMICYSYYYYPLYDEAYAKLTQIFEAAVDLRLKQLNIPKKTKRKFESLEDRIDKLKPHTTQSTIDKWQRTRDIRNMFAHRETGMFMGVTLNQAFYSMINIINLIFLDKNILSENEIALVNLKDKCIKTFKGPITFSSNSKDYIFSSIEPVEVSLNRNLKTSLWAVKSAHTYSGFKKTYQEPICIELSNVRFLNNSIIGTVNITNEEIHIKNYDQESFSKINKTDLSEMDSFYFTSIEFYTINSVRTKYLYNNWE